MKTTLLQKVSINGDDKWLLQPDNLADACKVEISSDVDRDGRGESFLAWCNSTVSVDICAGHDPVVVRFEIKTGGDTGFHHVETWEELLDLLDMSRDDILIPSDLDLSDEPDFPSPDTDGIAKIVEDFEALRDREVFEREMEGKTVSDFGPVGTQGVTPFNHVPDWVEQSETPEIGCICNGIFYYLGPSERNDLRTTRHFQHTKVSDLNENT